MAFLFIVLIIFYLEIVFLAVSIIVFLAVSILILVAAVACIRRIPDFHPTTLPAVKMATTDEQNINIGSTNHALTQEQNSSVQNAK